MGTQEQKKPLSKLQKVSTMILGAVVVIGAISLFSGDGSSEQQSQEQHQSTKQEVAQVPVEQSEISKEDAQKELDEIISLSKTAGLVTSYEFSDKTNVVYVTDLWYTMDVAFKKDLMAKLSKLKKVLTGFNHFEVRHTQSNEKVGEVTAFSKSLEIYK